MSHCLVLVLGLGASEPASIQSAAAVYSDPLPTLLGFPFLFKGDLFPGTSPKSPILVVAGVAADGHSEGI